MGAVSLTKVRMRTTEHLRYGIRGIGELAIARMMKKLVTAGIPNGIRIVVYINGVIAYVR